MIKCCGAELTTVVLLFPQLRLKTTNTKGVRVRACVRACSHCCEPQEASDAPHSVQSRSIKEKKANSPAVFELQLFVWKRRVLAAPRVLCRAGVAEGHALLVSPHLSDWPRGAVSLEEQRPHLVSTHNASLPCIAMGGLIDQVRRSY